MWNVKREITILHEVVPFHISYHILQFPHYIPATPTKLKVFKKAQKQDAVCAKVRGYCQTLWPKWDAYWNVRKSLTLCDDLLFYNHRIVVPDALRREILSLIHQGHQGVESSRARVKASVWWWPCVSSDVKQYVENCRECAKQSQLPKALLSPTQLPDYPWQQIGTDFFELQGQHYLLVVDYFSRFP